MVDGGVGRGYVLIVNYFLFLELIKQPVGKMAHKAQRRGRAKLCPCCKRKAQRPRRMKRERNMVKEESHMLVWSESSTA